MSNKGMPSLFEIGHTYAPRDTSDKLWVIELKNGFPLKMDI